MLRHLSIFGFALLLLMPALTAQQRAPQNESIRQEDLRADLFFLAGDSMRGRLTDTEENRATADFIRSRFERMGLKPRRSERIVLSALQPDDGHARRAAERLDVIAAATARRASSASARSSIRTASARAVTASGPVVFVGFGISAPHLQHDDYSGDVKGKIVLVLDHEPGERDPNSPFDGVVTSEPSTSWRKAFAAQEKGAVAVLFVSDVHNHPGAANFEATARNYWPEKPPRILNYTLAAWADRIRIPVAQISPAAGGVARRRQRQDARGARARRRRRAARLHAARRCRAPRDRAANRGRPSHRAGSQRRRAARRAAIRG